MNGLSIIDCAAARIPTDLGEFHLWVFRNSRDDKEHLAIVMGDVRGKSAVLVRLHSECFTGDVLGSLRCDCGEQLQHSLEMVAAAEGVVIYLRQEGRGIGLLEKLRAYNLQDQGYDTVDANLLLGHQADERDYTMGALILENLGVQSIRLMTNNPAKIERLAELGVEVVERVPVEPTVHTENAGYLFTKANRMNHIFDMQLLAFHDPQPSNGLD